MSQLTTLPSGLTVVTDEMAHVDSVAVGVWVETGTRSELEGEHGIAHFMEHMAFKGTANRSARAISEAIESVGGEINAATSVETTAYHARMLTEDLPLALDIISDILTVPAFDPGDVERERHVILQEIGSAEDIPEDRAFDALPEAAFVGQPLGRRILGTRASVGAISPDALRSFFAANYTAPAMTVVAAGQVDHARFVDDVARAFERVPTGPARAAPKATYTGGTAAETDDASECQLIFGFEGRAALHDDAVAAQLAAMVLGGGMSSRLFQALREERGLVYDTSAFHWAFSDSGVFAIHLATSPQDVPEARTVVLDELEAAITGITAEELDRAKAQLRAGLLMSRESCNARMGQAARQAIVFGRLVPKEERIAEIEAVTDADVRRILGEVVRSTPTLVTIGATEATDAAAIIARFGTPVAAL
ncbi:M16 family metallopeptidase [Acuticoccus yangtzensis]|uniref:M16 family metallopeptidase n=1 Tax=Acuticoccus yangtzensis TaxID=1443441 RepID=UPI00094979D3|nr:pitrilysin family protein [Acuticoccus yangtzensis]ORE94519.1 peptidase M16 family protein [Stappia sp. 22II-S9-Z10]